MFFVVVVCILKDFTYLFLERGEGREKERESNIDMWQKHWSVASRRPPTGNLAHNSGMSLNKKSNQWPYGLQNDAQPTEPYQSGLNNFSFVNVLSHKKWMLTLKFLVLFKCSVFTFCQLDLSKFWKNIKAFHYYYYFLNKELVFLGDFISCFWLLWYLVPIFSWSEAVMNYFLLCKI